jgi:biotin-dependent carboxylase-like uncharacterized protein
MLKVEGIGFYAQLVDRGRVHSMHKGYTESGALDWFSYEMAQALVANDLSEKQSGAIEVTLGYFHLKFEEDAIIAITGADCSCMVDQIEYAMYRPIIVRAGSILSINDIGKNSGMRVYLAIKGGIESARMFSSVSNVAREKSGGALANGQSLREGDAIAIAYQASILKKPDEQLNSLIETLSNALYTHNAFMQSYQKQRQLTPSFIRLSLIPSYQWSEFALTERAKFSSATFLVTQEGDRMGVRLKGSAIQGPKRQLYSQGLCNGAVQCAGGGQLIIMLNDRQTIGGYPVLGAIDAHSRAKLAQCQPNAEINFKLGDALTSSAQLTLTMQSLKNLSKWVDQHLN